MPGFSHSKVAEPNLEVEGSQVEVVGRQGLSRYNLRKSPKQKILIIASAIKRI